MRLINSASKIMKLDELLSFLASNREGKKIVFTNGCFDLVHIGHVDYLEKARNLGDFLIVALNTDASVQRIKGPSRPISPELSRTRVMASFQFVDAVVLFDEPTPLEIITSIKPDVLVKGNDYSIQTIVGADVVLANGGEVKTIPLVDGFSTSNFVEKMKDGQ